MASYVALPIAFYHCSLWQLNIDATETNYYHNTDAAGSSAVHEAAPLVKSVMLAGPRGTGKKMLVHAICSETGANMFDLTATNIAGKYPGKDGLKLLMHMVFKVSASVA